MSEHLSNFGRWALLYTSLGWPVHPLRPRSKKPILEEWQHLATTDQATVTGWWRQWPTANIGIATGHEVEVIDPDGPEACAAFDALACAAGAPEWRAPAVGTGGGEGRLHFYVKAAGIKNRTNIDGTSIDCKGDGGYVVAPPSIHPDTGETYRWVPGWEPWALELPELPDWLRSFVDPPRPPRQPSTFPLTRHAPLTDGATPFGRAAFVGIREELTAAQVGERNHTLNRVAFRLGQLTAAGELDGSQIAELKFVARGLGLGNTEVEKTAQRAFRDGMANPKGRAW